MGQTDLGSYKDIYLQTAKENISNILSNSLKLMENFSNKEAVNIIHINSHSLRTKSQVMGFIDMAGLSGDIEKISKDIADGARIVNNELIALLKNYVDKLNVELTKIER